jgi:hypothetical protein
MALGQGLTEPSGRGFFAVVDHPLQNPLEEPGGGKTTPLGDQPRPHGIEGIPQLGDQRRRHLLQGLRLVDQLRQGVAIANRGAVDPHPRMHPLAAVVAQHHPLKGTPTP